VGRAEARVQGVTVSRIFKSIGHGLLAAGFVLIALYFAAAYLKGSESFRDALDPLAARNYLVLAPLVPGALLLWLTDHIAARRRRPPSAELPETGRSIASLDSLT
jgi:hypothetical protein